jgi:hypothetical protein
VVLDCLRAEEELSGSLPIHRASSNHEGHPEFLRREQGLEALGSRPCGSAAGEFQLLSDLLGPWAGTEVLELGEGALEFVSGLASSLGPPKPLPEAQPSTGSLERSLGRRVVVGSKRATEDLLELVVTTEKSSAAEHRSARRSDSSPLDFGFVASESLFGLAPRPGPEV